jgi:hypothetical protein
MLFSPVFAKLQSRPSCSFHAENFDPAKRSLFPSSTDHGARITDRPLLAFNLFLFCRLRTLAAQWTPATPLPSIACGLFPSPWGCTPPSLPTEAVGAPLRSNGNASIPFLLVPLRSLSFTTRGVRPRPPSIEDKNEARILQPRQPSPLPERQLWRRARMQTLPLILARASDHSTKEEAL